MSYISVSRTIESSNVWFITTFNDFRIEGKRSIYSERYRRMTVSISYRNMESINQCTMIITRRRKVVGEIQGRLTFKVDIFISSLSATAEPLCLKFILNIHIKTKDIHNCLRYIFLLLSDDQSALFNPNCRNVNLLRDIKRKCDCNIEGKNINISRHLPHGSLAFTF